MIKMFKRLKKIGVCMFVFILLCLILFYVIYDKVEFDANIIRCDNYVEITIKNKGVNKISSVCVKKIEFDCGGNKLENCYYLPVKYDKPLLPNEIKIVKIRNSNTRQTSYVKYEIKLNGIFNKISSAEIEL